MTYVRHLGEISSMRCARPGSKPRARTICRPAAMTSTGSPLSPEGFDYVYEGIKRTCIWPRSPAAPTSSPASCSAIRPQPVWRGEIQGPGLGLAVDVWNDDGKPVRGEKGELVCTKAVPVDAGRLLERSRRQAKYHAAYFERFDNVWCHGDFAEWTEHGGIVIHGRSDATLNPGGVRIGTAEIYNQVEQLPEVLEALVHRPGLGQRRARRAVRALRDGVTLDEALKRRSSGSIRTGATPRHVPAKIVAVPTFPRTKSGKITELAVRDVVHGRAGEEQGGARQSRGAAGSPFAHRRSRRSPGRRPGV
jgi:acetoacetyl-CoA synthetase